MLEIMVRMEPFLAGNFFNQFVPAVYIRASKAYPAIIRHAGQGRHDRRPMHVRQAEEGREGGHVF